MISRILIVDDEPNVLRAWAKALRFAGYQVSTGSTAQEALELADEHPFDVAVLDFLMPSMDGVELLTRLRKKLPNVRAVVISGQISKRRSAEHLTSKLKEAVEADVYLHKPVSGKELTDTIQALLGSSTTSWKDVAKRTVSARSTRIKKAKETAKEIKRDARKKG